MSQLVRAEKKFTGNADCDVVDGMYADFFEATAPTVTELQLRRLRWGAVEARTLAAALPCFTSCRVLNLMGNHLGDAGGKAICESLGAARSMQTVNMVQCGLGDEAARALAAALQRNGSITRVSWMNNPRTGDPGGVALAEAVACNNTLKTLDLNLCGLGHAAMAALAEAASRRGADNLLVLRTNSQQQTSSCS
jgi:hypothetical protein